MAELKVLEELLHNALIIGFHVDVAVGEQGNDGSCKLRPSRRKKDPWYSSCHCKADLLIDWTKIDLISKLLLLGCPILLAPVRPDDPEGGRREGGSMMSEAAIRVGIGLWWWRAGAGVHCQDGGERRRI